MQKNIGIGVVFRQLITIRNMPRKDNVANATLLAGRLQPLSHDALTGDDKPATIGTEIRHGIHQQGQIFLRRETARV